MKVNLTHIYIHFMNLW